jgi:hypothetical protein
MPLCAKSGHRKVLIDPAFAALCRRLFPRRCEELQCNSRKAIFSATNKAEAVSAECNLLVWNGIFMALFWAY